MNKLEILETMFEVIKESGEWSFDCDDKNYAYFMDGVVAMTEALMNKLEAKNDSKTETFGGLSTKLDDRLTLLDTYIPDCCKGCSNHPSNGGSGICNCTLPYMTNTTGAITY